jgi:hypothetical protein
MWTHPTTSGEGSVVKNRRTQPSKKPSSAGEEGANQRTLCNLAALHNKIKETVWSE